MFDPEVLQILGLNLMAGKSPNFAENLGNAGLATMQHQRQREEDKYRKEEREFLKQQREMTLAQLKRQEKFSTDAETLLPQFTRPTLVPYNDTLGDQPPQGNITGPAQLDILGYINALPSLGLPGIEKAAALRTALQKESGFGKIDPKDYTQESVAKFAVTGNYADLTPVRKKEFINTGNAHVAVDAYSAPNGAALPTALSPEAVARMRQSDQHFWASYNKPTLHQTDAGYSWMYPPTGGAPGVGGISAPSAAPNPFGGPPPLANTPVTVPVAGVNPPRSEGQKKELQGLDAQLAVVNEGIAAAKKTPSAFGLRRGSATLGGALSESVAGRFDSQAESEARSFVFNVVSKVINERAGAAQSAQELARLRSFLPAETDNAQQVQNKLSSFQKYLETQRNVYAAPPGARGGASGGWGQNDLEAALSQYGGRR